MQDINATNVAINNVGANNIAINNADVNNVGVNNLNSNNIASHNTRFRPVLLAILGFLICLPIVTFASPWLHKKGEGIFSLSYFKIKEIQFEEKLKEGKLKVKSFDKHEIYGFVEYGILDDVNLSLKLKAFDATQNYSNFTRGGGSFDGRVEAMGVSDFEVGIKQTLYDGEYGRVAFQNLLKFPGKYSDDARIIYGEPKLEYEFALFYGIDGEMPNLKSMFMDGDKTPFYGIASLKARTSFDGRKQQLTPSFTLGLKKGKNLSLFEYSLHYEYGKYGANDEEYLYDRWQVSNAYQLKEGLYLQIGGFNSLLTDDKLEKGFLFSIWQKF